MNKQVMLHHGDCLEVMKSISADSVDCVIVDLPYGTTNCKWDSIIDLQKMWEVLLPICKETAPIVMTAQLPFDKVLGCSNLEMLRYEWIWEKGNATGHLNAKKMPMKAHENVLVFYRKLPTYNPQKTTGHTRKVSTSEHGKNCKKSDIYNEDKGKVTYDSTERYPRSVQFFSSDKQKSKLNPTQKPVSLMEYLVKTYSNEGETVLDFTMGSGTTGIACKNLCRNFIGIEKDLLQFEQAKERIENHQ